MIRYIFSLGVEPSVQSGPLFLVVMHYRVDQQCDMSPQRNTCSSGSRKFWTDVGLSIFGEPVLVMAAEAVCSQGSPPHPGSLCGWNFKMTQQCKHVCIKRGGLIWTGALRMFPSHLELDQGLYLVCYKVHFTLPMKHTGVIRSQHIVTRGSVKSDRK